MALTDFTINFVPLAKTGKTVRLSPANRSVQLCFFSFISYYLVICSFIDLIAHVFCCRNLYSDNEGIVFWQWHDNCSLTVQGLV